MTERKGICCSGNWIVDRVKTVDVWPQEETLANIVDEESGTGGAACNVAIDLSRFAMGLEISGIGLVGKDPDGERIFSDCRAAGIDTRFLLSIEDAPTAYTDVMTVKGSGRRTFFHNRGANALLGPEHYPLDELDCRILTLGYLLLLDGMDHEDPEYGTRAARVLAGCRERGILTVTDVVSEDSDRFSTVVTPALPHIDYLVINEIEAARTTGTEIRSEPELDREALQKAATILLERGVKEAVVVHTPEAAFGLPASGEGIWRQAHRLPDGFIRGSAGAGDAFFSGVVAGIHEGWDLGESLGFANAAAASCLRHPTCSGGVGSAAEIRDLAGSIPLGEG